MPNTVRELITALLEMPMDAVIEVHQPDVHRARSIVSVERMPNVAYGQQYVNLELNDA